MRETEVENNARQSDYRFSATPVKIPVTVFTDILKCLKLVWNDKRLQKAKAILKKKNNEECIMFPGFKVYYKTIVIRTV